jgi:hypothetical protein
MGPVVVALAILAAPVPDAAAQAAPRPEPTELWRQFPLDTERSNPVPPPGGGRTSPASAPQTGSPAPERRGRSLSTAQIAAIVLAMAVVLMLMTGVLAYVQHGPLDLAKLRRPRFSRSSPEPVDPPRTERTPGRRVGIRRAALRRATRTAAQDLRRTAAEDVHAMRAAAARLRARIASEAGALKARGGPRIVQTNGETVRIDEVATLKDRVDLYLDRAKSGAGQATRDRVNAKSDPSLARASTPADEELEVLKAKLGKPAAPVDDQRDDEVETLKAKLGRDAPKGQGELTTRNLLKRKLAERRPPLKAVPAEEVDVASLKAKLEVADGPSKHSAADTVDVDTPDTGTGKPDPGHAADRADLPPSTASATSRRSTAPAARPSSGARGSAQLGAAAPVEAAPVELVRSRSRRLQWPVGPEPLPLERLLATRCRIFWSRGYLKSLFYAVARTSAGDEYLIAESPRFRWNKANPPPQQHAEAAEAHRSLLELLERNGWSVAATGKRWFTLELERRQARGRPEAPGGERG